MMKSIILLVQHFSKIEIAPLIGHDLDLISLVKTNGKSFAYLGMLNLVHFRDQQTFAVWVDFSLNKASIEIRC